RIGPLLLHRVLRRQNKKRRLERVSLAAGRHVIFLHGLKQSRLCLGGSAIDLIGEDHVGEDRPFDETKRALSRRLVFFKNVRAGDVGRHQVRGELDAVEVELQHAGEAGNHQRLGQSRYADQQTMSPREHGRQEQFYYFVLADDDFVQLVEKLGLDLGESLDELRFAVGGGGLRRCL